MTLVEKYGKVALVAGASEGLGAEFARSLAAQRFDLILIARRSELLKTLATELQSEFGVTVHSIICDLSAEDALNEIVKGLGDLEVNLLVYNAVSPFIGTFLSCPEEQQTQMTRVNIISVQKLVYYFGGRMVERGRGSIILMSSLAGFQGSGFLTGYAASKAFIRVLAEGLWYEWKGKGVDVISCCAGAIATPNYQNSKPRSLGFFNPPVQEPKDVVLECLHRLGKTPSFVSGRGNRVAFFFMSRILSRKKAVEIMGDTTKRMYGIK